MSAVVEQSKWAVTLLIRENPAARFHAGLPLHHATDSNKTITTLGMLGIPRSAPSIVRMHVPVSNFRTSIGGDGPVVAETDASGWRLFVRGSVHAKGVDSDDLHVALRELALGDRELARDAFGVVMNCMGAWEDEYTEEHGTEALTFDDWMARLQTGFRTSVDVNGDLYYW